MTFLEFLRQYRLPSGCPLKNHITVSLFYDFEIFYVFQVTSGPFLAFSDPRVRFGNLLVKFGLSCNPEL